MTTQLITKQSGAIKRNTFQYKQNNKSLLKTYKNKPADTHKL